jgi:hypothetical protein
MARHASGEDVPVHGKGPPCRNSGFIGTLKNQAPATPQLTFQDATGTGEHVGPE